MARPLINIRHTPASRGEPGASIHVERRNYSEEREPWRVFKQSLAIRFTSKRHRSWKTDQVPLDVQSGILSAIEARRTMVAAYSGLQSGIRQLLGAAIEHHAFSNAVPLWQQSDAELRKFAREVAADADLPIGDQDELVAMLFGAEDVLKKVEPLTHGCIEVREERDGTITMRSEVRNQRYCYTPAEVKSESTAFVGRVTRAMAILNRASAQLSAAEVSSRRG